MKKTTTTGPKGGLRKYIPQPERYADRYGSFTLTDRDLDILELVYRYRHLESRHIRALIPGSDQKLTRRLQGLFHNKHLARYVPRARMRVDLSGSPIMAYGLETAGFRALLEQRGEKLAGDVEESGWRKSYTRRGEWFLEHALMISTFHCVLELATRESEAVELVSWDQSEGIRGEVKLRDGQIFRVNPDALFTLKIGDRHKHFFLEADRSSEEQRRIAEKYERYWWFLQSPGYSDGRPDASAVAVLFVTTGAKRAENMMQTLLKLEKPNNPKRFGGKGAFWFALDNDYDLSNPAALLEPIWRTVTKSDELKAMV